MLILFVNIKDYLMIKFIKELYEEYKLIMKYNKNLKIKSLKEGTNLVNFLFILITTRCAFELLTFDLLALGYLGLLVILFLTWILFKYWIYEFSKEIEHKVNLGYKLPHFFDDDSK